MTLPTPHDALCDELGCGQLCPARQTLSAMIRRRPNGTIAKGSSGNKYGLRSLRQIRKFLASKTNNGEDLILMGLAMAEGQSTGDMPVPYAVRAKVWRELLHLAYGKNFHVEHTGVVQHETDVRVAVTSASADGLKRLSVEQLREYHKLLLIANPPEMSGVEDAVFEEVPKEEEKVDG